MKVSQAMERRVSTRAFLGKAVPNELLHKIFNLTRLAPSNCNTQPCVAYVVSGEKKEALSALMNVFRNSLFFLTCASDYELQAFIHLFTLFPRHLRGLLKCLIM